MEATCKTCPFWVYELCGDGRTFSRGECRVGPRTVDHKGPDDWCCEHPLRQRDRLAAMAMQGMMAEGGILPRGSDGLPKETCATATARFAYEVADAMLAARAASVGERREGGERG